MAADCSGGRYPAELFPVGGPGAAAQGKGWGGAQNPKRAVLKPAMALTASAVFPSAWRASVTTLLPCARRPL